jgi:hypothetical protein
VKKDIVLCPDSRIDDRSQAQNGAKGQMIIVDFFYLQIGDHGQYAGYQDNGEEDNG